jgi:uncharacterized membrane protein YwzB
VDALFIVVEFKRQQWSLQAFGCLLLTVEYKMEDLSICIYIVSIVITSE